MSFTEISVDESTELIPKNHNPHYNQEHEDHGPSFVEKLTRFTSGVGKTYLTVILVCVIAAVSIVLLVTLLPDSDQTLGDTQTLKQSIVQPAEETTERNIIIDIPLGQVQGKRYTSRDGREYYGFLKLPYAQPPVGRLRFKHPQPPDKWEGVLNESQGPPCIQVDGTTAEVKGEENCLFLNIFTPKLSSNVNTTNGTNPDIELLPVIIYIYGGGFVGGNCNAYSPEYLMDEDVIWIAFNYRLGPFGFLNTEDAEIPGNLAFKDMIMLLKWVQENIESFGGDPNNISITGQSSGSISVSALMLSPLSEGLFQRAVAMSGSAIMPTILVKNPLLIANYVGQQLNCSTKTTRSLVRCLRDIDAKLLALVDISDNFARPYGITEERVVDPNDLGAIFMPDLPYNRLKEGKVVKVPYILGNSRSEQLKSSLDILVDPGLVAQLNNNWTQISPSKFFWKSSALDPDIMSSKIKDFYFQNSIGNDTWRNLTDLMSDHHYIHPTTITASWHAVHSPENVFLYYFTKDVLKSYADSKKEGFPERNDYGPSHGDELQFLYHYNDERFPVIEKNSVNYEFSKQFVKMWINFATTGEPSTPKGVQEWTPINLNNNQVCWLQIDVDMKMTNILLPRMNFWDQFAPEELFYV